MMIGNSGAFIQHRHPFGGPECDSDSSENELIPSLLALAEHPGAAMDCDADSEDSGSSEVMSEKDRGLPEWYKHRPFQYNGRVFLAFVPGFLLCLAIGGEFFLMILTIGSFAVFITNHLEDKKRILTVFFVAFVCCHFTVLYSAFPLIWKSAFNLILLFALNMHVFLTGGWVALQLSEFRHQEPMLSKTIETFLFGLYPWSSIVLITWLVAAVTSSNALSYSVVIFGFILLQLFLTPTGSSFYRDSRSEDRFILDPQHVGIITLAYCMTPPCLYLLTAMWQGIFQVLSIDTLIQWAFIVCLSVFLSTFFHVRQFLEVSGIPYDHIVKTRWSAGLFATSLLGSVLQQYKLNSDLLIWSPSLALIYILFGYFTSVKNKKVPSILCGVLVVVSFLLMSITTLPWQLEYFIGAVQLNIVYLLLLINLMLSVLCVLSSSYASKEMFGFVLLLHSIGFVTGGKLLKANELCSVLTLLCMSCCAAYLILKLYHAEKLPQMYAWLTLSVHLTIICDVTDQISQRALPSGGISSLYSSGAMSILNLAVTKILLFEEREIITFLRVLMHLTFLVISVTLNLSVFITPVWWVIFHDLHSPVDAFGCVLLTVGIILLKVTFSHQKSAPEVLHQAPFLIGSGLCVLMLQPGLTLSWDCGRKWFLLLSILVVICIVYSKTLTQFLLVVCSVGGVLALPLGWQISVWTGVDFVKAQFVYSLKMSTAVCLAVISWQCVKKTIPKLEKIVACIFVVSSVLTVVYAEVSWNESSPVFLPLSLVTLLEAVSYKYTANRDQSSVIGEERKSTNFTPYLGNLTTILAFIYAALACPLQVYEIWVIGCSAIFLLLQKDDHFLCSLSAKNHTTPTVMSITVTLIVFTVIRCTVWTHSFGLAYLCGICELFTVLLTLPVYLVLYVVLWTGNTGVAEKTIVFLTPPNALLFVFASSYTGWCLAMYGIAVGTWIMTTQLQITN